ncbi:hypothetical protein ACEWY4_012485 [Coilia grayii]|uniref:L1 transposable element RRM domain-containing protein n=1 Tax=Coilia grayii TaxID=363190 RepID=A0ABD1K0N4_9TELE
MSKKESETKKSSHTLSAKVANMATTANTDDFAMMLSTEMEKQREHFKEDMSALITTSLAPIQASLANFHEMVKTLEQRVTAVETTVGANFDALFKAEKAISELQTLNAALADRIDDLENRSRRVNLRIINVPEDSEPKGDIVAFVSALLKDNMGNLFTSPPELERAHRALVQKPKNGQSPRAIIVAFLRFRDRERVLHWARQNEVVFQGHTLRFYPDLSTQLSKKRVGFKNVKAALYQKGIQFRLLYPARLRVTYGGETLIFDTPADAETFYAQKVEGTRNSPAASEHED